MAKAKRKLTLTDFLTMLDAIFFGVAFVGVIIAIILQEMGLL